MPFTKVGEDDYVSPTGKHFTKKQVQLYYETDGFKDDKADADDPGKKVEEAETRKAIKSELLKRATRMPRGPFSQ